MACYLVTSEGAGDRVKHPVDGVRADLAPCPPPWSALPPTLAAPYTNIDGTPIVQVHVGLTYTVLCSHFLPEKDSGKVSEKRRRKFKKKSKIRRR